MEYVVTFQTSQQITPDDFRVINPSMKVTENTTIKELHDFFKKYERSTPLEVKVIQLL